MYLLGNSFNNQLILILNETFDEELKLNHGSNWKLLAGGFRIITYMHLLTQKHHKLGLKILEHASCCVFRIH